MTEPLIRTAGEDDVDAVLELWRLDGMQPSLGYTREGLATLMRRDPGALLLGVRGEQVLGSVIAAWDGWRGSFYRLVVHPDHRRRGLGTLLLREGERRLRALGARRLTAIVDPADDTARAFWEAAGYARQHDRARFVRSLRR